MPVCMTDQPLQTLSLYEYDTVLSEGIYTEASITAVDLCGRRSNSSEPIQLEVISRTTANISKPTITESDAQQSKNLIIGLSVPLAIILLLIIIVIAAAVIITIIIYNCKKKSTE